MLVWKNVQVSQMDSKAQSSCGGRVQSPEEARRLAGTMLPDIMPYAAGRAASLPDNGRTLTDDAADSFLKLYTHGKVTGDKAGPHSDLLADFPYVGPPHSYVSN